MTQLNGEQLALLRSGSFMLYQMVYVEARNIATGETETRGLYSGSGVVSAQVRKVDGSVVTRDYYGDVGLVGFDEITRVSGLVSQQANVVLSAVGPVVEELYREWDLSRAPFEVHIGLADAASTLIVPPAPLLFKGFVDDAPMEEAEDGGESQIRLKCNNFTQELRRSNSAMRSDADQRRRNPTDSFFRHVDTIGEIPIPWGM